MLTATYYFKELGLPNPVCIFLKSTGQWHVHGHLCTIVYIVKGQ